MLEEVRDRENKLQSEKEAKEALASKIKVCRCIGVRQWWIWELSQFFSVYENDTDDFNFCSMQAMESKLLVGGKNIVDHTNEQQRALEQRRREISDQKVGGNHFLRPKTFLSFEQ